MHSIGYALSQFDAEMVILSPDEMAPLPEFLAELDEKGTNYRTVEHIDEVCWFFPELKFVMRHGGEPWVDLAVKLMLKYPNLYYSTSAFAPKHYPKSIIHYANTRGADKIMYAGYFPMGLSLERIFTDMQNVPFKDEVWPKFLRENAQRVFKLDQ